MIVDYRQDRKQLLANAAMESNKDPFSPTAAARHSSPSFFASPPPAALVPPSPSRAGSIANGDGSGIAGIAAQFAGMDFGYGANGTGGNNNNNNGQQDGEQGGEGGGGGKDTFNLDEPSFNSSKSSRSLMKNRIDYAFSTAKQTSPTHRRKLRSEAQPLRSSFILKRRAQRELGVLNSLTMELFNKKDMETQTEGGGLERHDFKTINEYQAWPNDTVEPYLKELRKAIKANRPTNIEDYIVAYTTATAKGQPPPMITPGTNGNSGGAGGNEGGGTTPSAGGGGSIRSGQSSSA